MSGRTNGTPKDIKMFKFKMLAAVAAMFMLSACADQAAVPAGGATAVAPGSIADFRQNVGDRVFFDTDQSSLRPDARTTLTRQAEWLKRYGNYQITVEGHADERGTREYNLALGDRRATAVRQFLVAQGVPAARLKTISYGKERPEVVGSDDGSWSRNRRGVSALQ